MHQSAMSFVSKSVPQFLYWVCVRLWRFGLPGLLVVALSLSACSSSEDDESKVLAEPASLTKLNPDQAQFDQDASVAEGRINRVLDTLVRADCWDASFVTAPGIAGSVGSLNQYQFFPNRSYRHVGFSVSSGLLRIYRSGTYGGYDFISLSTWSDTVDYLVVVDNSNILYVSPTPNGASWMSVGYGINRGTCQ